MHENCPAEVHVDGSSLETEYDALDVHVVLDEARGRYAEFRLTGGDEYGELWLLTEDGGRLRLR